MIPILIVDDAREDLMLAETMLRRCKILNPIVTMSDGEECIRYFREERTEKGKAVPCLLFLDLVMHPTSGLNVLRSIVGTPLAKESLLVMLSGIRDIKTLQEGYQLGARTFLIKPLTPEDFMHFVAAMKDRLRVDQDERGYTLEFHSKHSPLSDTTQLELGEKAQTVTTVVSNPGGTITGEYVLQIR